MGSCFKKFSSIMENKPTRSFRLIQRAPLRLLPKTVCWILMNYYFGNVFEPPKFPLKPRHFEQFASLYSCKMTNIATGAYEQEHATPLYFCHGVFIDPSIFRSNLLLMRLPWECHNQSQDTNWRHCVTGPELPFFHKRKSVLKVDQSVKMKWHRLSMGVASSCSSAPVAIIVRREVTGCPGNHAPEARNRLCKHWKMAT